MKREKKNGSKRKPLEIQFWLRRRGILQKDIAMIIGRDEAMVSRTINGKGNSKRALEFLKNIGVPQSYFGEKG